MSKITKEQLIEILKHRISVASGFPESEKAQIDLELARIALASLEAEAVATFYKSECGNVFNTLDSWLPVEGVNKLYAEPQLPHPAPVSVPEIVGWEDVPEEITEDDIALASAWAHGFNQCRAAMLQGAEPEQTTQISNSNHSAEAANERKNCTARHHKVHRYS